MYHRVFNSISDCADLWDQLLPAGHHLKSVNCRVIERCNLSDLSFHYVIVSNQKEEIVAVAYFQMIRFHSKHYNSPLAKNFLIQNIEAAIMKGGFNILTCGNMLYVNSPGLFYRKELTTALLVFTELEKFFQKLRPLPHAILIKDWAQSEEIQWVEKFRFVSWSSDLTMKMDLPTSWKNFNDYVSALRHHYAQRARKARQKFLPLIRRELSFSEIQKFSSTLEQLYLEVVKRQSLRLIIVNAEYFEEMKTTYQNRFRIFGYFLAEDLIGFSSSIIYENLWELHYIGMKYEFNRTHWLYFNIMFDAIADAIEAEKKELELGRTAREAKSILGGYPVYFKNYVRIRGLIATKMVKYLSKNFIENAGINWEARNPFKI